VSFCVRSILENVNGATTPAQARAFIQDELDSAALYDTLASVESDERIAEVYRRLALVERGHADHWIRKLTESGESIRRHRIGWRTHVLAWIARRFGPSLVVPVIASQEQADAGRYAATPDRAPGMDVDERGHARALRLIGGDAGAEGPFIARLEGRHRSTGGNALRAAVLGANDGLLSNLSLVMGVAGASMAGREIVITGVAGLLAGAGSMALGEWLSVQSSRELYEKQIGIEAAEIKASPAEETEELALIYQAKGLSQAQARVVAERLMANEATALDTLAREELGIDPRELGGSAWQAGVTSFLLFAMGAIVPLLPFVLLSGRAAIVASLAASGVGLFAIGAGITLLTGRSVSFSGWRQVGVGLLAAGLTFGIGKLIGVSIR
jgi:VIT1/CCC1 family predicted Fe2+/Mn2+ transporter